MVNKYYRKHKGRLQKEACEDIKTFLKKKKAKGEIKLEKDIKILKEEKEKRHQYYQKHKQKLPEYRRN